MSFDQRMLAVIQAVYDAAMDEARWPEALKELSDLTGSQAATFWVLDGSEQPRLPTFTYINLDPAFVQEYLDRVAPLDPTVQYLVSHPNQPIVHDGLVITEREKDHHPYYDWHGRYSDLRFRLIGQVSRCQPYRWALRCIAHGKPEGTSPKTSISLRCSTATSNGRWPLDSASAHWAPCSSARRRCWIVTPPPS